MITMPNNTDECVYFTRRTLEGKGRIIAWAKKLICPECKKGLMGKPVEKGKKKIRSTEYVCNACSYSEEKTEHEKQLIVEVQYTCPYCEHQGEATTTYKRKTWQGVPSYVFECESCKKTIGITKKMKEPKKK